MNESKAPNTPISHEPAGHLDEATLAAHADGTLSGPLREAADAHLADCGECREAAVAIEAGLLAFADDASALPVPAGLSDRILARFPSGAAVVPLAAAPRRREDAMGQGRLVKFSLAAAAAGLAFVVGSAWYDETSRASSAHGRGGGDAEFEHVSAAFPAAPGSVVVPPRAPDLGASGRCLAHLSLDKPVYRSGERVHARAVILDAFDRKPRLEPTATLFQVKSGRGEVVFQGQAQSQDGVAAFGWEIPEGQAGGEFTLSTQFPVAGFAPAEASFDVRDFRVPRIQTDIQFVRKAYGPGDAVAATLEATRAEGGVPAGAPVSAVATVDGKEVLRKDVALDAAGRCLVTFDLPKEIEAGDGTLALSIHDGGVEETAAKTIPIVVSRIALALYPEGGDLVAGVPCRVYFEARTPKQKPADVTGRVVDDQGTEVARLESVHEGRGRFEFRPRAGRAYRVAIDRPAGIRDAFPLPAVTEAGYSLASIGEGFGPGEPVRVAVVSPVPAAATVGLYVRERELSLSAVRLEAGEPAAVALDAKDAAGVLRVTVYDAAGKPRAERLVFRRPAAALHVEFAAEPDSTVPGGHVRVSVRTTDDRGRPIAARVGLSATDEQVLTLPEPRDRAARLPVQALLGADVAELKDAAKYLGDDADSARRTDLLLGTQGWRRFAFADLRAFVGGHDALALRALASAESILRVIDFETGEWAADFTPAMDVDEAAIRFDAIDKHKNAEAGERRDDGEKRRVLRLANERGAKPASGPRPQAPAAAKAQPPAAPPGLREPQNPAGAPAATPPAVPPPAPADAPPARAAGQERAAMGEPPVGGKPFGGGAAGLRRAADAASRLEVLSWTRVFAHQAAAARPDGERADFTETVYWNAGLATDADGRASFAFDASDAVTTLRLRADAFSKDGALGIADKTVEVRRPFYVEPKMPLEVTAGDRIDLPLALVNGTSAAVSATVVADAGEGLRIRPAGSASLDVPARGSAREFLVLDVDPHQGSVKVHVKATAGAPSDDVTREIRVVPAGFPVERAFGGVLERIVEHEVVVPADVLPGSLATEAAVYPTPLSSLTGALSALLREPCGCFEQTSSSNYPNVMALQYLRSHAGVDPALVKRAADLLAKGYQRLVSFECKSRGYEWFGGDPGHEALSAYGVMEFTDMASVMDVDAAMLSRTRAWLLARRDGKGGFARNARALDSFGGAPKDTTDAYVLWALVEAGEKGLDAEIAHLRDLASASRDPYVLALAANVLWKSGDRAAASGLLARLGKMQGEKGQVSGAETSITRSGGASLDIETTSLAILAWLRSPEHVRNVEKAMQWLATACKGGRFGSTQGTILALKAIVAYDAAHARPKAAGTVSVVLDGEVLSTVAFPADQEGPIAIPDFGGRLSAGKHLVSLRMEGGADMPYALTVRMSALTPDSSPASKVEIATSTARPSAAEGDPVDVSVTVKNRTDEGVPMVVAIVGLPGGLEARAEALKELVKAGKVDAYETRGREVILYWRGLAPRGSASVTLSCLAAIPGHYTGPASRAYLYYTDEDKVWAPGLVLEISRR